MRIISKSTLKKFWLLHPDSEQQLKAWHNKMRTWRVLKTEDEYKAALKRLDEILDAEAGTLESDEADLLVLLVEKYENEHYPIDDPDPIEYIKFLMENKNLKQKDLAEILEENKGNISKILGKKRKLSIEMIRNLHDKLNISYDILMKGYDLETA